MSLLGIITSPGREVVGEAAVCFWPPSSTRAPGGPPIAPAGPHWGCTLWCSWRLLPSRAQVKQKPAIPSGPAAHKSDLFPSTLSLVYPPPYRVASRAVCPAGLAKFVPSQHSGQVFRGWVWALSSQNLERRTQHKVGAWGKADWCLSSLQGKTMNPQASMPEAIAQGSLWSTVTCTEVIKSVGCGNKQYGSESWLCLLLDVSYEGLK